ncbi:MAG: SiaC family regulatory phosphoprotein [Bacteroidia bacterium]
MVKNIYRSLVLLANSGNYSFGEVKGYLRLLFHKIYLVPNGVEFRNILLFSEDRTENDQIIDLLNRFLNVNDKFKIALFYAQFSKVGQGSFSPLELFRKLTLPDELHKELSKLIDFNQTENSANGFFTFFPKDKGVLKGAGNFETGGVKSPVTFYRVTSLNLICFKIVKDTQLLNADGLLAAGVWYVLNDETRSRLERCNIEISKIEETICSDLPVKDLFFHKTDRTPEISLNYEKRSVHISGSSYIGSGDNYFNIISEWIKKCKDAGLPEMELNINFYIIDTRSSKLFLEFLKQLNNWSKGGMKFSVVWNYDEEDWELYEVGEIYSTLIEIPFEFKSMERLLK